MSITFDAIVETHSDYYANLFVKNMSENGQPIQITKSLTLEMYLPLAADSSSIKLYSRLWTFSDVYSVKITDYMYFTRCTFTREDGSPFEINKSAVIQLTLDAPGGLPELNLLDDYKTTMAIHKGTKPDQNARHKLIINADKAPVHALDNAWIHPAFNLLGRLVSFPGPCVPGHNTYAFPAPGRYLISAPDIVSSNGTERRKVIFTPDEVVISDGPGLTEVQASYVEIL